MTLFTSSPQTVEPAAQPPRRRTGRIAAIVAGGVVILALAFGGGIAVGANLPGDDGPGQLQDGRFPDGFTPGQAPPEGVLPGRGDDSGTNDDSGTSDDSTGSTT